MRIRQGDESVCAKYYCGLFAGVVVAGAGVTGSLKPIPIGKGFPSWTDIKACWWPTIRSTVSGFIIGVLPGTGASVASAVAYTTEKRLLDKGTFGKGDMRGLAAPMPSGSAATERWSGSNARSRNSSATRDRLAALGEAHLSRMTSH